MNRLFPALLSGCLACALPSPAPAERNAPPLSIQELRAGHAAGKAPVAVKYEKELRGGPSFDAQLVSYRSSGLAVYAMVAVPKNTPAGAELPLLIANHGFHPDPPAYGITAEGEDHRPGDYYRPVPELYASEGFVVVMPDYRGHNISEGGDYARGFLASAYYTQDVLALLAAVETLELADPENVFAWGHSLGGEVTLRALLASGEIKAASLWAPTGGSIWEQAYYYSRRQSQPDEPDSHLLAKAEVDALREDLGNLQGAFEWQSIDPLRHLHYLQTPLLIHHATGDLSTPYLWSARLAGELYRQGKNYRFHSYDSAEHFFTGETRAQAVKRDIAFFRQRITKTSR